MNTKADQAGDKGAVYRNVRSLRRGLELLEVLSRYGWMKPTELAKLTGIDRSSIYRIVSTLEDKGFVSRRREDGALALTPKLRVIADGVRREDVFLEHCNDELAALTSDIGWPSDLALFSAGTVIIEDSTHSLSPITFHRATIHQNRSLFDTALGRAIMMKMAETELKTAIQIAVAGDGPDAGRSVDLVLLQSSLRQYDQLGYAWAVGAVDPKVSSIALGFRQRSGLIGSVNIVFFRQVLSPEQAADRFLPRLRTCIGRLSEI